ncbi:hypothetical protein [Phycicoccus sp. Root101]|uniref:hypothetical protein n=1 Tax=Phycicoccus sp. Root101 TaxID=1736421 RepID=UPI00070301A4|nr:hypothetical protein [Phycicoccus sp. Root101]KQU67481.1 hypothetical protein ASC58_13025 [Phycicoccus sp. Root101]
MQNLENPYAGQGPVLLDIGGDVGALVVAMPAEAEGLEVEIRPAGTTASAHGDHSHPHPHDHAHHDHDHDHDHGAAHHPHVGVVARPGADGPAHTLVYPEVTQGTYELVPIPGDTVVMTAEVTGGVVTYTSWPEPAGDA